MKNINYIANTDNISWRGININVFSNCQYCFNANNFLTKYVETKFDLCNFQDIYSEYKIYEFLGYPRIAVKLKVNSGLKHDYIFLENCD